MKDVRVYDRQGRLRLIIHDYLRLRWEEQYADCGLLDMWLISPHPLFDLMQQEKTLLLSYGELQTIITSYQLEDGILKIGAKPLLTLLSRRLLLADRLTLTGKPEDIIRSHILPRIPYLGIEAQTAQGSDKTVVIEENTDLLSAAKQVLAGTGIGMCIRFQPAAAAFTFSFLYPVSRPLRLSTGNRNLSGITCASYLTAVQNAGYYTEEFEPLIQWYGDVNYPALKDERPENYMKQYVAAVGGDFNGEYIYEGTYIYCDTPDGKLQFSDTLQTGRVRYISLEEDPVAVFEADLLDYDPTQASNLLKLRQYATESWQAVPCAVDLALGDLVDVEKSVGAERGIVKMQVRTRRGDTADFKTSIGLEPFQQTNI